MIRFPEKHLADEVVERIMQAEKRINPVAQQSQALDAALATPPMPTEAPVAIEDAIVAKSLNL